MHLEPQQVYAAVWDTLDALPLGCVGNEDAARLGCMAGSCGMDPALSVSTEAWESWLFTWPQHLYDLEVLVAELSAWS